MPNLNQKDTLDLHTTRVSTTHVNARTRGRLTEIQGQISQLGRLSAGDSLRKQRVAPPLTHHDQPRASSRINDNYCVTKLQTRLLAGSTPPRQTMNTLLNVDLPVVKVAITVPGLSQKKELSPGPAGCYCRENKLKYVKSVSCVTQLSCVKPVSFLNQNPVHSTFRSKRF